MRGQVLELADPILGEGAVGTAVLAGVGELAEVQEDPEQVMVLTVHQ